MSNIELILPPKEFLSNYKSYLSSTLYKHPSVIFKQDFPSFEDLISFREAIRFLHLVPIKSEEMHVKYHSVDKEDLLNSLKFEGNFLFMENSYPYELPEDVSQNILWIKDSISDEELKEFLINKMNELNLGFYEIILFERPSNITTKLIKKSFPYIRHIHFWMKKK